MSLGPLRLTAEPCSAGAVVAAGHVLAEPPVHARVRLALVVVNVTVGSAPARVTETFVSNEGREEQTEVSCFESVPLLGPFVLVFSSFSTIRVNLCSPVDQVMTAAVDAGVAVALVHL